MPDKEEMKQMWEDLKTRRDELRVQAHLAKAEAKDLWDDLEEKWKEFEPKAKHVVDATADASKEVAAATKKLGKEILAGYAVICSQRVVRERRDFR